MPGPFVTAVMAAESMRRDDDHEPVWECEYYIGPDRDWHSRRLNVYMETRRSALGPEWHEFQLVKMRMRGEIAYACSGCL